MAREKGRGWHHGKREIVGSSLDAGCGGECKEKSLSFAASPIVITRMMTKV